MTKILRALCLAALALPMAAGGAEVPPAEIVYDEKGRIPKPLTDAKPSGWRGVNLFIDEARGNCVACHTNPDVAGTGMAGEVGPTIGLVAERYTAGDFRAILVDAGRRFGDDTPMPAFYGGEDGPVLTAQEIEDLVAYLMELKARTY